MLLMLLHLNNVLEVSFDTTVKITGHELFPIRV